MGANVYNMYCTYNVILQNTSHAKNTTTKTLPPLQPGDHEIIQGSLEYYIRVHKLCVYAQCCSTFIGILFLHLEDLPKQ